MSVRQTLALSLGLTAVSVVLGAAGFFGYQLYRAGQQAERLRVVAMAEVYAAQMGGVTTPAELQGRLERWEWHPGSRLLAVLDENGRPVAVRGDRSILEKRTVEGHLGGAPSARAEGELLAGNRQLFLPDVGVAVVPIIPPGAVRPVGCLVYAARTAGWGAWPVHGVLKYLLAILGISVAGMAMGSLLLWHSLLGPLKMLLQVGRRDVQTTALPADLPDEIGSLARLLEDLTSGLEEWRERAVCLEASVDRRVKSETHDVTLKLRQAERTAWLDPLTRLGNRRMLDEKFAEVFSHSREAGEDLALVMIDVDNFKTLNDTLGHKAGDELLKFIGELLRQCVREDDLAIRYGGDEFLLVFPGATAAMAAAGAERIVRLFGQQARLLAVEPKPSMSAGVASLREHRPGASEAFLQMVDKALYQAKRLGKSRVCVCGARREAAMTT